MVWESAEPRAQFLHLALDSFLDREGQLVEDLAVGVRPDLKRRARRRSRLARTMLAGRNLGPGLFQLGLNLVCKFELVFE